MRPACSKCCVAGLQNRPALRKQNEKRFMFQYQISLQIRPPRTKSQKCLRETARAWHALHKASYGVGIDGPFEPGIAAFVRGRRKFVFLCHTDDPSVSKSWSVRVCVWVTVTHEWECCQTVLLPGQSHVSRYLDLWRVVLMHGSRPVNSALKHVRFR